MTTASLENAPFRLKAGVGETDLAKASAALQAAFLAAQPSFGIFAPRSVALNSAIGY